MGSHFEESVWVLNLSLVCDYSHTKLFPNVSLHILENVPINSK